MANDHLDLRQPVWINDIQWLNQEATQLVVGTAYHQVRLYDTKSARRPIMNMTFKENPIRCLSISSDGQ